MAPSETQNGKSDAGDEEEDDYMTMAIAEPGSKTETSIQRRVRREREAEIKNRPKTQQERDKEDAEAREAALSTSLDSSNKGFKLLQKLGFTGGALGKGGPDARTEPVRLVKKDDRGGVGMDTEKKRKIREQAESESKRVKADEEGYRERVRREREEKRLEGQIIGAMTVAEGLDEGEGPEAESDAESSETLQDGDVEKPPRSTSKPLKKVNVLWRGLVKHRLEKEQERRRRADFEKSLSRLPTYDDPDEDADDKRAFGKEVEDELDEEDEEMEEFNALELEVRLAKIVEYLRERHHYCFWCKFQYPDDTMDGCPGTTEEDHD